MDEQRSPDLSSQAEAPTQENPKNEESVPSQQEGPGETSLKKSPKKRPFFGVFLGMLLVLLLVAIGGFFTLFYVNTFTLSLQLQGETELIQEYGEAFSDPGAAAVLYGSLFWKDGIPLEDAVVTCTGQVDTTALGKYTLQYRAQYRRWTAFALREVRVVDSQPPVITLKESAGTTVLPGQKYQEEGFSAVDNHDGDITQKVRRVEEYEKITYVVMDSSGNPASVERIIPYYDPLPPEILLTGGEQYAIPAGTFYEDPGFCATDNADGDLTEQVEVAGDVIWYQPGVYPVTYTVSDTFGNETVVTRQVEVTALPRPLESWPSGKTIYLTFDDGPGPYTSRLLDILAKYDIKATFFVVDSDYSYLIKRMAEEGHSVAIHTASHNYSSIYASPEAYFEDLLKMQQKIYDISGVKTTLMRFPGGSSNLVSKFNEGIMTTLSEAVLDAGFQYFDWNVDSNDAGGALRAQTVVGNVLGGVMKQRVSVVLQHDVHDFSVDAVEDIILWGLDNGYTFLPLKPDSPAIRHTVQN